MLQFKDDCRYDTVHNLSISRVQNNYKKPELTQECAEHQRQKIGRKGNQKDNKVPGNESKLI